MESLNRCKRRMTTLTLGGRLLVFCVLLVLCFAAAWPLVHLAHGPQGVLAAGIAFCICLLAGVAGLATGDAFRARTLALHQLLFGMFLRMGIPLGAFLWIYTRGGPLIDAGFPYYLIAFYLAMLAIEVSLMVPQVEDAVS